MPRYSSRGGIHANAPEATAAAVALLQRIYDGCKMAPMVQQLSHLKVCHRLLTDRTVLHDARFRSAVRFAKMVARDTVNSLLPPPPANDVSPEDAAHIEACAALGFVELLFHKTRGEALEIGRRYLPPEEPEPKPRRGKMGERAQGRKGGANLGDDDDFGDDRTASEARFFFSAEEEEMESNSNAENPVDLDKLRDGGEVYGYVMGLVDDAPQSARPERDARGLPPAARGAQHRASGVRANGPVPWRRECVRHATRGRGARPEACAREAAQRRERRGLLRRGVGRERRDGRCFRFHI